MKNLIKVLFVLLVFSSCDVHVFEAPYDARLNFVGYYEAEEYSETYGDITVYDMDILSDENPYSNDIYLRNFYGLGIEVFAIVNGDRFTIPKQEVNGLLIQGTGRLNAGEILMTYSVQDLTRPGLETDFCNAFLYYL